MAVARKKSGSIKYFQVFTTDVYENFIEITTSTNELLSINIQAIARNSDMSQVASFQTRALFKSIGTQVFLLREEDIEQSSIPIGMNTRFITGSNIITFQVKSPVAEAVTWLASVSQQSLPIA